MYQVLCEEYLGVREEDLFHPHNRRSKSKVRLGTLILVDWFAGREWGCWLLPSSLNNFTIWMQYTLSRQCCGSMTFWYGSGYADPCLWLMDPDPAQDPAIFVIDLQDANSLGTILLKSHKTLGINPILTIFALWQKEPESDPDPYLWTDSDPGGP